MDENEVVEAVKNWIRSEHPEWVIWRTWNFDLVAGPSKNQPSVFVECKGAPSMRFKAQRAMGQCLDYTTGKDFTKISCFIAVPKDFIFEDVILETLEYHRLPIGLLTVDDNGEVTVLRRGKESHIEE